MRSRRWPGAHPLAACLAALSLAGCGGSSGSGTAEAGGADTSAAGADAGGGICGPAGPFAGAACNPLCDPSGCSATEVCSLAPGGALACVAPGPQKSGFGCTADRRCQAGACVAAPGEAGAKCRAFCGGDTDCPSGERCILTRDAGGVAVRLCAPDASACSVFAQDCPGDQGCYVGPDDAAFCSAPGALEVGAACQGVQSCRKGLICVNDKCREFCNPTTAGAEPKCATRCPSDTARLTPTVGVCAKDEDPVCDLKSPACAAGTVCYFTGGPSARCKTAGTAPVGAACTQPNDCQPSLACWAGHCQTLCAEPGQPGPHAACTDPFAPCSPLQGTSMGFCDE